MRHRVLAAVAVSAIAGLSVAVAPPAQAAPRVCKGSIGGGFYGPIVVPAGAKCVLNSTRVSGDVTVERNATLTTHFADIQGDVVATGAAGLHIVDYSKVTGDVRSLGGGDVRIDTSGFTGDVIVRNHADKDPAANVVNMSENTVVGHVILTGNKGGVRVALNHIGGDLRCFTNTPEPVGKNAVEGNKTGQCNNN